MRHFMKVHNLLNNRFINSPLLIALAIAYFLVVIVAAIAHAETYPIVDTGQILCYDNDSQIAEPVEGEAFYGQDAQFDGNQPSYTDNGDGTVTDNVTGLMWVQARGEKVTWADAYTGASACDVAGYSDWRMPTIKEIYSLILFSGNTGNTIESSTPYLDTDVFEFEYGDESAGERIIDCQDWSATRYVHLTMNGDSTAFGVNFADGRIKGYPIFDPQTQSDKELYVRYVRGNTEYGINDFSDNGDGTITDNATLLMWSQNDSQQPLNWEEALAWVQAQNNANALGYSDWRLPNAKELQSIVDYTRSPATTNSAAIDPMFNCTQLDDDDYPWYYTGTTHQDGAPGNDMNKGAYVCFGRATGWMEAPPNSGTYLLWDVHGAGAQRSDFKSGDPEEYPYGHGPQGDVIRIYNYVRLVRDENNSTSEQGNIQDELPQYSELNQNYPNPFNPATTITFNLAQASNVKLTIYNSIAQEVKVLVNNYYPAGSHSINWMALDHKGEILPAGIYFYQLETEYFSDVKKMILLK